MHTEINTRLYHGDQFSSICSRRIDMQIESPELTGGLRRAKIELSESLSAVGTFFANGINPTARFHSVAAAAAAIIWVNRWASRTHLLLLKSGAETQRSRGGAP